MADALSNCEGNGDQPLGPATRSKIELWSASLIQFGVVGLTPAGRIEQDDVRLSDDLSRHSPGSPSDPSMFVERSYISAVGKLHTFGPDDDVGSDDG
jgi:hypothetical protein